MVMEKLRLKYFPTAFFHSEPQRGVPCGTGRTSMGRAPFEPACMNPPPMKPRPEWSKLSPLNSSIARPRPPAPMKELKFLSSKNRVTEERSEERRVGKEYRG